MTIKASLIVPVTALLLGLGMAVAGPNAAAYAQQEQIYGRALMTEQEQDELRTRMRNATSQDEREQIRWEHHLKMQERAKERGVMLPEEPLFGMHQRPGQRGGQGQLRLPKGGGGGRGN
ncbi:MAG: hypothetical protein R3F54_21550 [Alphaproteobacteria bacterium]